MPYIDVDLLKESVLGWNPPLDTEQLKHMIDTIPLADVVEVVRCKDCKRFCEYSDAHKRAVGRADGDCFLKQSHSYDHQFIACRYNDFCSYGERKQI